MCVHETATTQSTSGEGRGGGGGGEVGTTMAVPRNPTPPPPDMTCPVAENWCYTQVSTFVQIFFLKIELEFVLLED